MASRCAIALVVALLVTPSLGSRLNAQRTTCSVAGRGITADVTTSITSVPAPGGNWTFSGAGKVKVADGGCPHSADDPIHWDPSRTIAHGEASEASNFTCAGACCVTYCCGTGDCFSTFLLKNSTTTKAGSKKKRICLASVLRTRTHTQDTEDGWTPWVEETAAAGTCVTGINGGKGLAEFSLCGPGTLELSTGMNCGGPESTTVHETTKTMDDCTNVSKPATEYWNSYKVTCAPGNER